MPRAASAWRPEFDTLVARAGYPPARRLRTPAQFAAVIGRDGRPAGLAWHGGRRYLAAQARITPVAIHEPQTADTGVPAGVPLRVRFGVTVGKRHARRAVDRALVKRVLRESARAAASRLEHAAGLRWVDVVLRLKAPCPPASVLTPPRLRHALRAEADALLAQLEAHLRDAGPHRGTAEAAS